MVNTLIMMTRNVKNAQKIVLLVMDQLMTNVIVVKQIGTYTMELVSNHAQKVITDIIDNVTHVTLIVKHVMDLLKANVLHVTKVTSLPTMDTLVLDIVKMDSMETQIPENVKYVMEHVAHVMDHIPPTV